MNGTESTYDDMIKMTKTTKVSDTKKHLEIKKTFNGPN